MENILVTWLGTPSATQPLSRGNFPQEGQMKVEHFRSVTTVIFVNRVAFNLRKWSRWASLHGKVTSFYVILVKFSGDVIKWYLRYRSSWKRLTNTFSAVCLMSRPDCRHTSKTEIWRHQHQNHVGGVLNLSFTLALGFCLCISAMCLSIFVGYLYTLTRWPSCLLFTNFFPFGECFRSRA